MRSGKRNVFVRKSRSLEANNETLAMENSRLADERRILREERDRAAARAAGLEQELEEAAATSDGQAACPDKLRSILERGRRGL